MNFRQPVFLTRDGLPVFGVIVGRCFHHGEMHYDVRVGASLIHVDVPEKDVKHAD
jgi:hypothetical protein